MINAMTWLESLNCPVVRQVKHAQTYSSGRLWLFYPTSGAGILWETDQPQLWTPKFNFDSRFDEKWHWWHILPNLRTHQSRVWIHPQFQAKPTSAKRFFFSTSHLPVVKQCAGQGGSEGHHRGHKKKPWRNQPCTDRCIPRLTGARTRALAPERDMEDLEFRRLTTRCFKRADERMIAANSQCLMMLGTSNDCKEHGFKKKYIVDSGDQLILELFLAEHHHLYIHFY